MIMPTLDESHNRSIEGFGIAYIEAAFLGIPSVASNSGGTSEAVLHKKTGIIIDNHKHLFQVINDLLLDNKVRFVYLTANPVLSNEIKMNYDSLKEGIVR